MKEEVRVAFDHSRNKRVVRQIDALCIRWGRYFGGRSGSNDFVAAGEHGPATMQLLSVENCSRAEEE